MGVSLWIVPDEKEADKLDRIIAIRPDNTSTISPASYPKFHPHITLASLPLEYKDKLDVIETSIPKSGVPLKCSFTSVDIGSHYFRSVYVTIKPTAELDSLHKRVHESLAVNPRTPVFPHMSLCYIDDIDAATGQRLRFYEELKKEGKISYNDDISGHEIISLNCGAFGDKELLSHFGAYEVWAVLCEGPVESWEVLRKFSFITKS
ncbi:2',3'-cyclic-nucleotide 3'-phosphodiesterase [Gymnopilus junonius]|uniref:2',3'-cyclic-nucleotide 3'-phosphodiesterase n=1 Tax=Gymnopilus junonius TaxID=109634 RepID=A0A9P5TSQ7_GYMJU|nr:2',3'-cyclic-nucleotide 3'-phosphodiesterase [Gymnopilus junonius]